ncbi:MAG: sporulation protein YunB [Eubacteriales bacterium]|jgi:sporulation protein YunB
MPEIRIVSSGLSGQRRLSRRRHRVLWSMLLLAGFFSAGTAIIVNQRVGPVLQSLGVDRAASSVNRTIYQAVEEVMEEGEIQYDDLVRLETDGESHVTALVTNVPEVNRLKSAITTKVIDQLSATGTGKVGIPLGSLLGPDLLAGRGPLIYIKYVPLGSVKAEISNQFSSAGINQTRHQILLEVETTVGILLPGKNASTQVSVPVLVGESVIVGQVPDSYTNVEGDDGDILDKINNYCD